MKIKLEGEIMDDKEEENKKKQVKEQDNKEKEENNRGRRRNNDNEGVTVSSGVKDDKIETKMMKMIIFK